MFAFNDIHVIKELHNKRTDTAPLVDTRNNIIQEIMSISPNLIEGEWVQIPQVSW